MSFVNEILMLLYKTNNVKQGNVINIFKIYLIIIYNYYVSLNFLII